MGCIVVLVASEPRRDGLFATQTLSEKINEEEDVVLQIHALLPELDHQTPQVVPGAAQVHNCEKKSNVCHKKINK